MFSWVLIIELKNNGIYTMTDGVGGGAFARNFRNYMTVILILRIFAIIYCYFDVFDVFCPIENKNTLLSD